MRDWLLGRGLSNNKLGVILALMATLCYSLKPILIKLIYIQDVSSLTVLSWRMIISLPIYIAIGLYLWKRSLNESKPQKKTSHNANSKSWIWKVSAIGILGYYFAALFDLLGLQYISSQLARLILFTYPTLVALLGWIIFRHKMSKSVLGALVISYIGLSFIFFTDFNMSGENIIIGSVLMFLSVLAFSLYVLLSKSLIDQVGGSVFTVVAMLASSVCILLHLLIVCDTFEPLYLNSSQFFLISLMTLLTTVIPSFLIAEAIAIIGPQRSSIAGTFGPVATSILAVFILGEAFGIFHFIGLVLVVCAIYIMQRDSSSTSPQKGVSDIN